MSSEVFPELTAEQDWLEHARRCRLAMIERLRPLLDSSVSADEFTDDYVRATALHHLDDLADESSADFFGRIDGDGGERLHIGRRHIDDERHDPVVVDWRAGAAAPFYRATVHDALGLQRRRRFTLERGRLTSYHDDRFDDPDALGAGGIPDPVLAELGAARTGAMREIVATIQAEQDLVIRAPLEGCLVVQGGPGTGKTAVGLHRAAYLLFEHRRHLADTGVLVVGPNRVFLDYVAHVLPSLGERSVLQRTLGDLAVPKVALGEHADGPDVARLLGDGRMAGVLVSAALARITVPGDTVRAGIGSRLVPITPEMVRDWLGAALDSRQPVNRRRRAFRALVVQELGRVAPGGAEAVRADPTVRALLDRVWPPLAARPLVEKVLGDHDVLAAASQGLLEPAERALLLGRRRRRGRRAWTPAELPLLDEATGLLDGPPATYGHVIVDEAQDLSVMALRMLARRCPSGSFTVLGDLAQSTQPAGHRSWTEVIAALALGRPGQVEHLTVGYRVPGPILEVANRLLPLTGVDTVPGRSARADGEAPRWRTAPGPEALADLVAEVVRAERAEHPLTGVVTASGASSEALRDALGRVGLVAVAVLAGLGPLDVPVFAADEVKGLEFDAVVVVRPHELLEQGAIGARLLYVAMTRAVQRLTFVTDGPVPAVLAGGP